MKVLGPALLALAILMIWNRVESGHYSGLVQQSGGADVSAAELKQAIARARTLPLGREFVKNHLWSGGWAFLKPRDSIYGTVIGTAIALLVAAGISMFVRRRVPHELRQLTPFAFAVAAYGVVLVAHILTGAIAAMRNPAFPTIGAEGWYFDAYRPVEAAFVAAVCVAAVPRRHTWLVVVAIIVALVGADVIGTTMLILPHWAGADGTFTATTYRAAVDAAPIHRYPALPLVFMLLEAVALFVAIVAARARRLSASIAY
jgi:hypothetical protein